MKADKKREDVRDGCVFCEISRELETQSDLIREGMHVFLIPDIKPVTKGHALVISKSHFPNLSSTPDEVLAEAILFAKEYALSMTRKCPEISGFNYISNEGSSAKQVIFHLHMHIIPRY